MWKFSCEKNSYLMRESWRRKFRKWIWFFLEIFVDFHASKNLLNFFFSDDSKSRVLCLKSSRIFNNKRKTYKALIKHVVDVLKKRKEESTAIDLFFRDSLRRRRL